MENEPDAIEIFKTNVQEVKQAELLIEKILEEFPSSRVNFALDDCDRILRVQGRGVCNKKIIELLNSNGYEAQVLL